MDRVQVASSNITSVGYDVTGAVLEVEFSNGNIYQYFDVPEIVHKQLIEAGSVGEYLNGNIKGIYRYARL